MRLHKLKIQGFRRHKDSEIHFSNASFLIGENNTGKSTILKAIELLLTDTNKLSEESFFQFVHETGIDSCGEVVLTAEFRELPPEAFTWRGFRGRIFKYKDKDSDGNETVGNSIFYRKTFKPGLVRKIEMKSITKKKKEDIKNIKKIDDFIDAGFQESYLINTDFENEIRSKPMPAKKLQDFIDFFENQFDFYDYSTEEIWDENPGGIAPIVISRLPKVLYIPAHDGAEDLKETKGAFQNILVELFADVRNESENYKQAQILLDKLADELDPENSETEFGKMMVDLNQTLSGVFSGVGLNAKAKLSDANSAIKPTFSVSMISNIPTPVEMQGTGVIRSTVFALLRYKALRDMKKNSYERPLIICFEEPEIYLHPNAATQMRDTIYELANTGNNQIVCSTHSPYMIDLGKRTGQLLNYLYVEKVELETNTEELAYCDVIHNRAFNIQEAFTSLQNDEKDYVKLILKMDDYLARIFFARNVLIVEGDTEEIVLRETIPLLPEDMKKNVMCNWQIIRARGKASIISLVKYLKAMGIVPFVMHDLDLNTPGAVVMNEPIKTALNDDSRLISLENCIEDVLGYSISSKDKPYKAYKFIQENWKNDYNNISDKWKEIINGLFSIS
ncbi:ATP-dependent nuclease [Enterococcus sp.]|uniref:ATP-dependent nuclease n=1 Tax=Enterococcus sp. TaxID=35783 RepID=UPI00290A556C|nr:AAA family ATPase [Enterococcus sp.]MDU5333656.1 AAA family ATPase [Enterococcus sp.]